MYLIMITMQWKDRNILKTLIRGGNMDYSNRINELEYALGINIPLEEALKAMRIEPIRKKRLPPHFCLRHLLYMLYKGEVE